MRVIDHLLDQRLPDTLHGTAVELPDHDRGVDHPAHIVDRGISHHRDLAGLRREFNFTHVAAIGPGRPADCAGGLEENLAAGLAGRQFKQADAHVCAFNLEAPGQVLDVLDRGLQRAGGHGADMLHGALCAHLDRRATDKDRARPGAAKTLAKVGVARHHPHLLKRYVKHVHHQLRQRGCNALPHAVHGRKHLNDTVRQYRDRHAFFKDIAAGPLQKSGNTQPTPFALARRLSLPSSKPIPVGKRQALVQHVLKAAAVIHLCHRVLVGHLFGANHVAPTKRNAVDTSLARCLVHQALHDVDGLRPAGTPVRAHRRGVGEHRLKIKINGLDVIHAGLHPGANQQLDGHAGAGGISADIGQGVHPQGQNTAISRQGQFSLGVDITARGTAEKIFTAVGDPFHWAFERPGAPSGHRIFGVDAAFHAKAAAHIAHGHPHLVAGQAQNVFAQRGLDARGHLGAHTHHQSTIAPVDHG